MPCFFHPEAKTYSRIRCHLKLHIRLGDKMLCSHWKMNPPPVPVGFQPCHWKRQVDACYTLTRRGAASTPTKHLFPPQLQNVLSPVPAREGNTPALPRGAWGTARRNATGYFSSRLFNFPPRRHFSSLTRGPRGRPAGSESHSPPQARGAGRTRNASPAAPSGRREPLTCPRPPPSPSGRAQPPPRRRGRAPAAAHSRPAAAAAAVVAAIAPLPHRRRPNRWGRRGDSSWQPSRRWGVKGRPQRQPPPHWLPEAVGGGLRRSKLEADWLPYRRLSFDSSARAHPCAPWRSPAGYGSRGGSGGAERAKAVAVGIFWEAWGKKWQKKLRDGARIRDGFGARSD